MSTNSKNKLSKSSDIAKIIASNNFSNLEDLLSFIRNNPMNLSLSALARIAELSNTQRTDDAAFYTNKALITEMMRFCSLPFFRYVLWRLQ